MRKNYIAIFFICFYTLLLSGQDTISIKPGRNIEWFGFKVCSNKRQPILCKEINYYNSSNKVIVSALNFYEARGQYKRLEDSIKTVSVLADPYFPRILTINYDVTRKIDTLYLERIANDSLYLTEGIFYNNDQSINNSLSFVALKTYGKFLKSQKHFSFTLLIQQGDIETETRAGNLYNKLLEEVPAIKGKITLEKMSNPEIGAGIYMKAKFIRR